MKADSKKQTPKKKPYQKPQLRSESITHAELGKVCNGNSTGGRKADVPCTTLLS